MAEREAAQNTDREIWRGKSRAEWGDPDRFYADSLFVPAGEVEALGINCGGYVLVLPIREWHRLAAERARLLEPMERLLPRWRDRAALQRDANNELNERLRRGETVTIETTTEPHRDLREICAEELEAAIRDVRGRNNGTATG